MGYRGNSFYFDILEPQKLLYMFLSDISNAIEFYNKFDYIINSNTTIEELDDSFEVLDNSKGVIEYYASEPRITFSVKDKKTKKVENFEIYEFYSITDLPYCDEEYDTMISTKIQISKGENPNF